MIGRRDQASFPLIIISSLFLLLACFLPCVQAASPDPAWGRYGVIATADPLATQAGFEILENGGNAMDAALAAVYMLSVVEGYSSGIGGGEFWMIRVADSGEILAIDGRETAPAAAFRDMYVDSTGIVIPGMSTTGILAGGIPGSIAAREYIFENYASKSRREILEDAIEAAEDGFVVSPYKASYYAFLAPKIGMFEDSRRVMFRDDSTTWQTGDRLIQRDLANTLKRISRHGAQDFYHGETARQIVAFMEANGGLITMEDLENYEITVRTPVHGVYRGYDVYSMPPPSSGGVHIIQMLNVLEGWDVEQFGRYSARYYHHLTEVMEAAFADRAEYLGDPGFYDVPVAGLTSLEYAEQIRDEIPSLWAREIREPGNPRDFETIPEESPESGHTTHLSVIDRWGNMVALTSTINTGFGSGVILGNTGIWLNNEMDDFSAAPGQPNYFGLVGNEANAIEAGKRPLSSMTPTLILSEGEPFISVGASGGPKIITATLQTILNVVDFGADIQDAINAPRVHHQWKPDALFIDPDVSPDCAVSLYNMGHRVVRRWVGSGVQGVMIDLETGIMYGGADPRSGGSAAGVE